MDDKIDETVKAFRWKVVDLVGKKVKNLVNAGIDEGYSISSFQVEEKLPEELNQLSDQTIGAYGWIVETAEGEGVVEEIGFRIKSLFGKRLPEVESNEKLRLLILSTQGAVISGGGYVQDVIFPGGLRINSSSLPFSSSCVDSGFSRY